MAETYEILVIGGGPAGLSASLVLGRCRRRVCIVDSGHGRNERAHSAHGIFTRDGATPAELRAMGRAQLAPYDVTVHDDEVVTVSADDERAAFVATTRSGRVIAARKLLLASGMRDRVPDRPGLRERFGRGVYVCPYCDGWEVATAGSSPTGRSPTARPISRSASSRGATTWCSSLPESA